MLTTPSNTLADWHEFYMLLGTASATLIGLLFVAASVAAGVFSGERRAPLRLFLSASVVNFSLVLATSLTVLAPFSPSSGAQGMLILGYGCLGLLHSGLAWRDTRHDQLITTIDLEDRTWYVILPALAYLCLVAAGIALVDRFAAGCIMLAGAVGLLLGIGIHNAWDITVWIITRRRG